ncbi:protein Skeletor, isoforms B/C-like isoform X2 [Varroa jacobsoni]|uniref:Protein Skeletor n=1 Tax=Varroa destructor TaxID=109461 RepID=A0A7M7KC09_VARDE|nr:protein Skeletor, isoforms B/C-like isoform X2 [Varroa destructor]XP_022696370.1 protein Skeletor, isoforms B/C-like isoform X2 [Varroa jacobsoni]
MGLPARPRTVVLKPFLVHGARWILVLPCLVAIHCTTKADGQLLPHSPSSQPYYGVRIGKLTQYFHDVAGEVFVVDDKTLFLKGFSYDGQGPDAYFWAGTSQKTDGSGFIIPNERGSLTKLGQYRNKDLILRLPGNKSVRNIQWISIWCKKFSANFADLYLPRNLQIPKPVTVEKLPTWDHGVTSGPVTIVDSQTFLVPGVMYDGLGPAAYWWVSKGERNHRGGLRLADENGSRDPLPRYTGKTVVINLPDGYTIYDFDRFGIYCELADVDFGSIKIPHNVKVPPSQRAFGIHIESALGDRVASLSPARSTVVQPQSVVDESSDSSQNKLNCEILHDPMGFELRWIMDGDEVIMQLVGRVDVGEYMAFGLSMDDTKTRMVGSDAVVTWIDHQGRGHAVDYYLGSKEQCVGKRGACPDIKQRGARDSVTVLNTAFVNGYHMITYKRPQVAYEKYDQHVYSDGPQAIVWALGPINGKGEVSYHKLRTKGDLFIDFARAPQWNCPKPDDISTLNDQPRLVAQQPISQATARQHAWVIPPVACPADNKFYAQIGPAGGKKGYQAITGHVGWGIAWYINGLMIPELYVQRGVTYTFVIEGGNNKTHTSKNHPFYITSDPTGGYEHKSQAERRTEKVFAGVSFDRSGRATPTAKGRLCNYEYPFKRTELPDDFATFEDFATNLEIKCQEGRPAYLQWTPDQFTPDLVYYQCYTHRHLGWKIHVVDNCADLVQQGAAASQRSEIRVPFPQDLHQPSHKKHSSRTSHMRKLADKALPHVNFHSQRVLPLDNVTDLIVDRDRTVFPRKLVHRPRVHSIRMESGFRPVTLPPRGLPDPTTPRPGQMGPLPFLRKDPLPFQGSFKPGVPHFGGFNISYASAKIREASGPVPGLPQVPQGALTKVDGFLDEDRLAKMVWSHRLSRVRRSTDNGNSLVEPVAHVSETRKAIIPEGISSRRAFNSQYDILDYVLRLIADDA